MHAHQVRSHAAKTQTRSISRLLKAAAALVLTSGAGLAAAPAEFFIPPRPRTLSIANGIAEEGFPVEFVVSLSRTSTTTVAVNFTVTEASANGVFSCGIDGVGDFVQGSGVLIFEPGQLAKSVQIPTCGDRFQEEDVESFHVTLSQPSGATLLDAVATGAIVDNDREPLTTQQP
jgi:hypothetical protein